MALAFDVEHIWVSNNDSHNMTKLRATDGELVGSFAAGNSPIGIAFDGENI